MLTKHKVTITVEFDGKATKDEALNAVEEVLGFSFSNDVLADVIKEESPNFSDMYVSRKRKHK